MFDAKLRISFVLAAVLTAATATAAAADCKSKTADFDSAVSAKSISQVAAAYNVIQKDSDCDFDIDDYRPRAISAMIGALSDPAQAADREAAMKFAAENLEIAGNWALAEQLGDYFASLGQRVQGDAVV